MAIAITLRGFNVLGRSVTPIFLWMVHFSLPIFYGLLNKEKIYHASWNSVHLTSSFRHVAVSTASLRVKVCENDGNILNY